MIRVTLALAVASSISVFVEHVWLTTIVSALPSIPILPKRESAKWSFKAFAMNVHRMRADARSVVLTLGAGEKQTVKCDSSFTIGGRTPGINCFALRQARVIPS